MHTLKYLLIALSIAFGFIACQQKKFSGNLQIIPQPQEINIQEGYFRLHSNCRVFFSPSDASDATKDLFAAALRNYVSYELPQVQNIHSAEIRFLLDSLSGTGPEGYQLRIADSGITIKATRPAGLFYGMQTLLQLLSDLQFFNNTQKTWNLPALEINDAPSFSYRGLHLDVSRHFFPVPFIKKWIDLISTYKLNTFHWHLTDAGGWRLEIKKYPALTQKGAWRTEIDWRKWWNDGDRSYARENDANAYGGYYTQNEVKEIIQYAADRHIRIIPEIEMPGHSEEVLAAYPALSCFGKNGKNGEFCAGKEETFEFIENVLQEVIDLFPSEYIHIGGDEASKTTWRKCPRCQQRIKTEHLKNEKELQSYFIKRIEKFLRSKGKKLIGWDEILEGGLAPEATVMSWRGEQGGIEAARAGHPVIMTPGAYCYFDSYQADPTTQPYAIGGFTPYLKVYDYHPVSTSLSEKEARYILGAQANLWTEYIHTPEHVEYMLFPRLLALAEVVWTPKEQKDKDDFKRRVKAHISLLQQKNVNVFTLSDRVEMTAEPDTLQHRLKVTFENEKYQPIIRYTLNGQLPDSSSTRYEGPFHVTDSAHIKAAVFNENQRSKEISSFRFDYHKAIGKKVIYKNKYSSSYPAKAEKTLTDGYKGGLTYSDGHWQGFLNDIDVTVDLGKTTEIGYVAMRFMQLTGPGVYMPHYVSIKVSEDGINFHEVGRAMNDIPADKPDLFFKDFVTVFQAKARYINIFARKQAGFLFTDEIIVY